MLWHLTWSGSLKGWLYTWIIYTFYMLSNVSKITIISSPFLWQKMSTYTLFGLWLVCLWISHLQSSKLHLHTCQYSDQLIMALAFNSDHIIYYDMDAMQSVVLMWTYFIHPTYLVVQYWVHTYMHLLILLNTWGLKPIVMLRSLQGRWAICL